MFSARTALDYREQCFGGQAQSLVAARCWTWRKTFGITLVPNWSFVISQHTVHHREHHGWRTITPTPPSACENDQHLENIFVLSPKVSTDVSTTWPVIVQAAVGFRLFQCSWHVVISQTHWLVSQERLSSRAGTSVFIMYSGAICERWF